MHWLDRLLPARNADPGVDVVALVKGGEQFVFMYPATDEHRAEILRAIGRAAANPELSFTWYDAAVLSQKIRETETNKAM